MSRVLGVSCFYHDAAVALVDDGQVVAAAEEERFSRRKHDWSFPARAIEFCLREGGVSGRELDYVAFYERPIAKWKRVVASSVATAPRSLGAFTTAMTQGVSERFWIRSTLRRLLGVPKERIVFVDHHLAHAASAFFTSPFAEAAVVTLDGVGEWTTAAIGRAEGDWNGSTRNSVELTRTISFPHSLGLLYSAFTAYLGFEVNEGEYKVMGLAAYGVPRFEDAIHELVEIYEDGSFWLDMSYFEYHRSARRLFNRRFELLLGAPPRARGASFVLDGGDSDLARRNQHYADVAASIQRVTEEIVVRIGLEAQRETASSNLCLAGGVALNGLANARLWAETPIRDIFIPPAPGDSGGALGAALYVEHVLLGRPRTHVPEHAYWGEGFDDAAIRVTLGEAGVRFVELDREDLTRRVSSLIAEGKVVGWFQGRFEWGPRALGNRSILADPRRAAMKGIVNRKIKYREPFRPFAPTILAPRAGELIDPDAAAQFPARFMLFVLPLSSAAAERIPAVSHFGTTRPQVLSKDWNPAYYELIEAFAEESGVPAVLNTSFNLSGEPIVASPADALSTFGNSGLDALALGSFLVEKRP